MNLNDLFLEIKDDLSQVEGLIHRQLNTEIPLLNEVAAYILDSGGKRLRPALVIYCSRMFGGADERTYVAAGALEFRLRATGLEAAAYRQRHRRYWYAE